MADGWWRKWSKASIDIETLDIIVDDGFIDDDVDTCWIAVVSRSHYGGGGTLNE